MTYIFALGEDAHKFLNQEICATPYRTFEAGQHIYQVDDEVIVLLKLKNIMFYEVSPDCVDSIEYTVLFNKFIKRFILYKDLYALSICPQK